jgi:hypothetical protein
MTGEEYRMIENRLEAIERSLKEPSRDQLAAMALQGLAVLVNTTGPLGPFGIAERAYEIADAMIRHKEEVEQYGLTEKGKKGVG